MFRPALTRVAGTVFTTTISHLQPIKRPSASQGVRISKCRIHDLLGVEEQSTGVQSKLCRYPRSYYPPSKFQNAGPSPKYSTEFQNLLNMPGLDYQPRFGISLASIGRTRTVVQGWSASQRIFRLATI